VGKNLVIIDVLWLLTMLPPYWFR